MSCQYLVLKRVSEFVSQWVLLMCVFFVVLCCCCPLKPPQKSAYAVLRDGKGDRSICASVTQYLSPKQAGGDQLSDIAYPQILQEIADGHKFSVTFVDVMEPTATGKID